MSIIYGADKDCDSVPNFYVDCLSCLSYINILVYLQEAWNGICGHVPGALACQVEALGLFCSAQ